MNLRLNQLLIAVLAGGLMGVSGVYGQTHNESAHAHEESKSAITGSEQHGSSAGHEKDEHDEEGHDEQGSHEPHKAEDDKVGTEHAEDEGHADHGNEESEGGHSESASAVLSAEQMTLAGVEVTTLTAEPVDYQIYAPGEILSNGYTTYRVSPRVASVVMRRHVALGDHVKKDQPLVTLFSESVAQAQAEYRTALPEWRRVQQLGRKTVGEQRYIGAKANFEATRATLLAYGLSNSDLESLASQQPKALGEYTLRAEIDGAVLSDDFEQGQRIEAGAPLITLADEGKLWVQAHLPADLSLTLGAGTTAEVVAGGVRIDATVSQEAHTIDPVTRTRVVRLLVDNTAHRLHPGQFAEVFFRFRTKEPVLAVPETALMRGADGDWTVYVEDHPGEFLPKEVDLGRALGPLREIKGVRPASRVVTKGSFFVASQIAKGGFDPHNH